MEVVEFIVKNNAYLILLLLFVVFFFLMLQYLLDYLIIGRNFDSRLKNTIRKGNYNINSDAGRDGNVIDFESNKRFLPTDSTKLSTKVRIKNRNNFESKNLLNLSEQRFFRLLSEILTDCHIFPQVSFNALMTHASWISRPYWQQMVRSKFNAKYVDFVACKKLDLSVLAVIEYDGLGHRSTADSERDSLLTGVGYRVERFTHHDTPHSIRLRFGLLEKTNLAPPLQ